jgi:DNA-binding transcriptional LysR family regulator
MLDYRLKVFDTVARRLSFTKAADELCITQPAVSRHIKKLERDFRAKLFERKGNGIVLTQTGRLVLKHTSAMRGISLKLEYEISQLNQIKKGTLRIGASTTIAQYVLPSLLAGFHETFRDISLSMLNANTELVERALLDREIDIGMIEGESKRRDFHYQPYATDEIVLVTDTKNHRANKGIISIDKLVSIPMLLREPGSGTLEVLSRALKKNGIKLSELKTEMTLGSSEAIKSYLKQSDCMAFISRHAILDEIESGSLKIIGIENFSIKRRFLFITPQGPPEESAEIFIRFASLNYKGPGNIQG